jgi:hypothetical protein
MYCEFKRPTKIGKNGKFLALDINEYTDVIWAFSPRPRPNFENKRTSMHYNSNYRGVMKVKFRTGEVIQSDISIFPWKMAHGLLMGAAWGIFYPAGIFLARYGKSLWAWWKFHVLLQLLGTFCILIALGIIGPLVTDIATPHGIIGIIMCCLLLIQLILGVFNVFGWGKLERMYSREFNRRIHQFIGLTFLALSPIQIYLGMDKLWPYYDKVDRYTELWPIFFTLIVFWSICYALAEAYFQFHAFGTRKEKGLFQHIFSFTFSYSKMTRWTGMEDAATFTWKDISTMVNEG